MKKTVIITGIVVVVLLAALFAFNKFTAMKKMAGLFTEVSEGRFEVAVTTTGELLALKSVDILGPDFTTGRDIRMVNIKITDMITEGTEVKKGDYIARLDRTEFENTLKDERDRYNTYMTNLEVAILDTSVTMNSIRDQITNQIHTVEEAKLTLRNSKYETPTIIRQAEINADRAERTLDQLKRSYQLRKAQSTTNVNNRLRMARTIERRVKDYEEVLQSFTVTAPSEGMVIYKKDRLGTKRKVGSSINPMDRVIATLPDLTTMLSKVYVSEIEVSKIKPGLPVTITVDAFPANAYKGKVTSIANIGETLPNSDSKVFEVMIQLDGTDMNLRPSMTTNNKIMIREFENVVYVPTESIHTGTDSIPVVYTKSGAKQVVILGDSNGEDVIIEKGLKPGQQIYIEIPENEGRFRLAGKDLIDEIKAREKVLAKN